MYDLPKEILETLELKLDHINPNGTETLDSGTEESIPQPPPANGGELPKSISCALCHQTFPTVQDQRNHVRSDLHSYNLKQRVRGAKPVSEHEFEAMVAGESLFFPLCCKDITKICADLDESLSGSDTESSEDEENGTQTKKEGNMLSTLLKRQANIDDDSGFETRKRKRGSGKAPIYWFGSSALPTNTSLGIYRSLFTPKEQEEENAVAVVRSKQLSPPSPPKRSDDEGGVPLPSTNIGPHIFMCMIGGGHFAGMLVSLTPKVTKTKGVEERQASVLAHKTFHRYTTRRKQGGAQSSNDMAKGNAHSAGASIRRYNEEALTKEVRELLTEWKDLIATSDLIFIRATSNTNRRTLFGPYDGQILRGDDPRIRGFPFSTRRPTQAELMRCFVELTRVKIHQVDEVAEAEARAKAAAEEDAKALAANLKKEASLRAKPQKDPAAEVALLHTSQLEAMIRRAKGPALVSYISTNSLSPDFVLHPPDSQQHHHAPTPLHLAASLNLPALISTLLAKSGADPRILNGEGKTAFEVAGDRATRDAFRLARSELGESRWDWAAARVPDGLSRADVDARAERERRDEAAKDASRRAADLERLKEEEKKRVAEREGAVNERRERKMGKGTMLGEKQITAEERREQEARGMTPEMRMRLERERRARAAERRMQQQQ